MIWGHSGGYFRHVNNLQNDRSSHYGCDAGARINDRDDTGWTPLMYAARYTYNSEIITTLLDAGADGKARDEDGKTAFDLAKENEYLKGTDAYWQLNYARF